MVTLTIVMVPFTKSKRGVAIKIRVEPRSSRKGLSGVIGDTLKVKVHAPPVGGAANEQLIGILSEEFGLKKSAIKIIRGQSSRDKVVEIEGIDSLPDFRKKSSQFIGKENAECLMHDL